MNKTPKPRVLLRADSGPTTGFGHFVRSCALAGYLSEEFDCRIASFNTGPNYSRETFPSAFQTKLIEEARTTPVELKADGMASFDQRFLEEIKPDDIVVLDNYYFTTQYQAEVKKRCRALVCIDDVHDRHFVADAVITFCPLHRKDFSLEESAEFRGGIEWAFLRKPFLRPVSEVARDPERIVMAMGGADPLRLTDKIAEIVVTIAPGIKIDVLAGATVEVKESAHVKAHRNLDASGICALFDRASLGIFPASTVCVEALARRLPVAAGHFVDNQEEFYADGVKRGWFYPLGDLRDGPQLLAQRIAGALRGICTVVPEIDFVSKRDNIVKLFTDLWKRKENA